MQFFNNFLTIFLQDRAEADKDFGADDAAEQLREEFMLAAVEGEKEDGAGIEEETAVQVAHTHHQDLNISSSQGEFHPPSDPIMTNCGARFPQSI